MILGQEEILARLRAPVSEEDSVFVAPQPDLEDFQRGSGASLDLRLGTWFVTTKLSRHALLDFYSEHEAQPSEHNITTRHFVPFGRKFILHPKSFVLATTLEWIRLPKGLAGYVTGKSSWGRRGLVIETAPGVHPGFSGCLTLELANVGELPIALMPGTKICQLFLHLIKGKAASVSGSFIGYRQPLLGTVKPDAFAQRLIDRGQLFD